MKKTMLILLTLFSLAVFNAKAQNEEKFKPSGKPEALIFADFANVSTGGSSHNKFELTRAYLGYSYNFSPMWSGRIVLDAGNPGVGSFQYTVYVKNAYLQYLNKDLTVKFGMVGTTSFAVQEKFWGYRYILKSFQDQYGMNPSADLGASVDYKFSDFISADAILENGEGYKINDVDSVLKVGVGLTVHPVKQVTLRGYYDNMTKRSTAQQTVAVMAGYANSKFSLAMEYNDQIDYKFVSGRNWSGVSAYGTYRFSPKFDLFARYDNLTSVKVGNAATAWDYSKDGQLFLAGLEFIPVKGIRIAPNYQLWNPRDNAISNSSTVILNVEIKL